MPISENQIDVAGKTVHYYEAGVPGRKCLLLLHGHLGDAWMHWSEAMNQLSEDYYLVAPDLPGYGVSDPLPTISGEALVAWAIALLDALGLYDAVAVGNSFGGGLTARLLGAYHPERIPAVVLVNGGTIPSVPGCAKIIAATPGVGGFFYKRLAGSTVSRSNLDTLFGDDALLTDEIVGRVQAQRDALAGLMRGLTTMPKPEKRFPPVPVLLLWGQEDSITPRIIAEGLNEHIPGSKLELISDVRHVPHIEVPEVFAWQVTQFLTQISRPGDVVI
jgi:pimeloyl-ACP methyl ester carboxylesterase